MSMGGSTTVEGGSGGADGGVGGYGGEVLAGAGGETTGGTGTGGSTTTGGTTSMGGTTSTGGATSEGGWVGLGGTDGGPEAGAGGGGPAPLTCSDGCANLYVPPTDADKSTYFTIYMAEADLTGVTVTARVRARGYTGTRGFVTFSLTGAAPYPQFPASGGFTGVSSLANFTNLTLDLSTATAPFDPAHVIAINLQAGGNDAPLNLEVDQIVISGTGGSQWLFTQNTTGLAVNANAGTPVTDSAVSHIPAAP
jgi:hypothetical protein